MTQMQCNMFRLSMPHLESVEFKVSPTQYGFRLTDPLHTQHIWSEGCKTGPNKKKRAVLSGIDRLGESIWRCSTISCLLPCVDLVSRSRGILAGGIPGFRMVLCCFPHLRVWPCVCLCSPLSVLLCLWPYYDEMTQCCHLLHWICHELVASHSFVCWFLVLFCFGGFCLFVLFVCFCLSWLWMMTAYWTVQVPSPVLFCGPQQQMASSSNWNYCFCNAIERVKRPGGSHEGVGRKKNVSTWFLAALYWHIPAANLLRAEWISPFSN